MAAQPQRTRANRRSTRTAQPPQSAPAGKLPSFQAAPLNRTAIDRPALAAGSYPHPRQLAIQPVAQLSPTKQAPQLTGFQRLSLLLDGKPHYLEQPGPQNRILLSIKSTLPQDTDYGLEVLLAASFFEPDLIPLPRFPGLIDALLDLIDLYRSPGIFHDPAQKATRRRALEATLVVRNLLCIDSNASSIPPNHPRLLPLIIQGLRHAQSDSDHEFVTLLLEILESLASYNLVRLDQPVLSPAYPRQNIHRALHPAQPSEPTPDQQACRGWSTELVWQLDRLTQSSDRALVLAAYRCFTAIGSLTANQVALTSVLFGSDPARSEPSPWPKAIERALVLLVLPDVEMLLVVLDYLYTLTSASAIALSICYLHPDILAIFKLLLVHVHHNCRLERLPAELLPIPEQKWYFQRPPAPEPIPEELVLAVYGGSRDKSPLVTGVRTTPQAALTMTEVHQILLPESQLKDVVNLSEPNRARQWMSRVFEAFPGGEVQQVTLWLAYKTQFEHLQSPSHFGPGIPMIAPAEAIKLTSDVFPNALPSVTEHKNGEKKFVISGMRVRPKKHAKIWKCNWKECAKNASEEESEEISKGGPERLYRHVEKTHITPRANKCYWLGCTYQAGNRAELLLHVRTHILYLPPPAARGAGRSKAETPKDEAVPYRSYIPERWETPNTGTYLPDQPLSQGGGAVGIGFVAVLVLRNLLSSVADALTELVKSLDHQDGRNGLLAAQADADGAGIEEPGWRVVDVLQDHYPTSEQPGPIGLSSTQVGLVRLAQLLAGSHPPPSSWDTDGSIDGSQLPAVGILEKEARTLLTDGPHFVALAADILHLLASITTNLHSLDPMHM